MRELKFRVWSKNLNRFYSGEYFSSDDLYAEENGVVQLSHNDWVIQQYTGLKDCNGKEIYDGDIIQIDDKDETRIYKVVFEDGYFGLYRGDKIQHALLHPYKNACKIIGNFFENPELLK